MQERFSPGSEETPATAASSAWSPSSEGKLLRPEDRYNRFSALLFRQFGARVFKVSLDVGFTCPNRDGTLAKGGCIYCLDESLYPPGHNPETPVREQLERGMEYIRERHRAQRFIAYFQTGTGTYAPVPTLKRLYREALEVPGVIGLAVATRSDCVANPVLRLLGEIASSCYCWLELGLPSSSDRVLKRLNRAHDRRNFINATRRARDHGVAVCTHVILGLPGESREEMLYTAELLNQLPVSGVKIHNLHVIRGTTLEQLHRAGKVPLMALSDYACLVTDFLERLSPRIAVHRLTGETHRRLTVAPGWSANKMGVLSAIHLELTRRETWQGRYAS